MEKKSLKSRILSEKFLTYALVFLLPVGIMYIAYAIFGVHPYGDGSVLVLDLNGQYVYYYEAFRRAFFGDGSLVYSWSRNLSGSMFGIFSYYLASPFMILTALFPRSAMCGAIETIQLLKIGTASVSFCAFLRYTAKKPPKIVSLLIFPTMYSLMSYMTVQLMDPMWLDGLIYLPLICIGVRKLISKGKILPFLVPLSLMFIAHFYIGYMVGIFTFFYFLHCLFGETEKISLKKTAGSAVRFGIGTLVSIFIASAVLVPTYNTLKLGKLEFSQPDWSMKEQFDILTLFTKFFPLSYDTVYPEGLPMVYCGLLAVVLVPLFFLNGKVRPKRKASFGIMTAVMTVLMYLRPADMVMHGFQMPNWLPFRYSFTVSFLILCMAFEAFENLDGISFKQVGSVVFACAVFLFWCERQEFEHFVNYVNKTVGDKTHMIIGGIWFSLIALGIYLLVLWLSKNKSRSVVVCIVSVCLVGLEMLCNTLDTLKKIDDDVVYSKYISYEPYMSNTIDAVKQLKKYDTDKFYRVESDYHRTVNDPIAADYYGISHSSSVMNAAALMTLKQLGYAYGGHYTNYYGTTLVTDSVFGIRYLFENTSKSKPDSHVRIPEEYEKVLTVKKKDVERDYATNKLKKINADYNFYKNPYAAGLGTKVRENILSIKFKDGDPFYNQNVLYSALSGEDHAEEYFKRAEITSTERVNISVSNVPDEHENKKYTLTNKDKPAYVDYVVNVEDGGELYMYFPSDYERSCKVYASTETELADNDGNMQDKGRFFAGDDGSILLLGEYEKGSEIRVRVAVENEDEEAYWYDEIFCTFDKEKFKASAEKVRQNAAEVTSFSDRELTMITTASQGEYLFTTIPYELGWKIKVNGKDVKIQKSIGSMITIPLENGENKIELRFSPDYYKIGWLLTLIGLFMAGMIFMFEYKNGRLIKRLASGQDIKKNQNIRDSEKNHPTE